MTTLYVFAYDEVSLVYTTKERAEKAKSIYLDRIKKKYFDDLSVEKAKEYLEKFEDAVSIFEIKEGEAFGEDQNTSHAESQDIILN